MKKCSMSLAIKKMKGTVPGMRGGRVKGEWWRG
jgi:hypothetical protein